MFFVLLQSQVVSKQGWQRGKQIRLAGQKSFSTGEKTNFHKGIKISFLPASDFHVKYVKARELAG